MKAKPRFIECLPVPIQQIDSTFVPVLILVSLLTSVFSWEAVAQEPPTPARTTASNSAPTKAPEVKTAEVAAPVKRLVEAKNSFDTVVTVELEKFVGDCREVVKREAATGADPALVKMLLNEIDLLEVNGTLPALPQFGTQRKAHVDARRVAASELYAAYKTAVADLTKDLDVDKALEIKAEMEEFVRKEQKRLGLVNPMPPSPAPAALPEPDDPMERLTGFSFPDFTAKFVTEVERVAQFDTGAKRDQEHRKMMERFDQNLKSRSIRLHFPITEVTTADGRTFVLHFSKPDEMKGIPGIRLMFAQYRLEGSAARDAVNLRPGDVFELIAKPRISTQESHGRPAPRGVDLASIPFDGRGIPDYYFYVQSFDYVIRKKRERDTDSPDDSKSKKSPIPSALKPAPK